MEQRNNSDEIWREQKRGFSLPSPAAAHPLPSMKMAEKEGKKQGIKNKKDKKNN